MFLLPEPGAPLLSLGRAGLHEAKSELWPRSRLHLLPLTRRVNLASRPPTRTRVSSTFVYRIFHLPRSSPARAAMAQPQSGSTSPPGPTSSSLLVDAPSVRVRRPTRANTLLANVDNPALQSSSGPALADANSPLVRRRRGATITERLFAAPDGYTRVVADERTSSPVGRARSSSRASSGVAVDVVIPGEEAARARRGSLGTEAIAEEEHHHNDEVHVVSRLSSSPHVVVC